jgi:hypothetical protein
MADQRQLEAIVAKLRRSDNLHRLKLWALIVLGPPLTLTGPLILATIFWFACVRLIGWHVPWLWLFLALTVVMVPLLLRLEVRTAGRYLGEVLDGFNEYGPRMHALRVYCYPGLAAATGATASVFANPRATSAGLVEVFLTGPRLMLSGWRGFQAEKQLASVDRFRAGNVIVLLLTSDRALKMEALLSPGEELNDLLPTLAYLAVRGWIGLGERMTKVWLDSTARDGLQRI